jgi:hypothetical protein
MALPASDSFNRSNEATLVGNWTCVNPGPLQLLSNAVRSQGTGDAAAYWNADAFDANHYSECKVATVNDGGPAVRVTNNGCYYWTISSVSSQSEVWRYNAPSTWTKVGEANTTVTSSDVVRLEATGTGATVTLKTYKNGSAIATLTDTSASRLTSGAAGVYSVGATILEDWGGGNVSSATTYTETASDVSTHQASGDAPVIRVSTAQVVSTHQASARSALFHAETVTAQQSKQASAVDKLVQPQTGAATSSHQASGADVLTHVYIDAGAGQQSKQASGTDALVDVTTGQAQAPHVSSAVDALVISDTGGIGVPHQGLAIDAVVLNENGEALGSREFNGTTDRVDFASAGNLTGAAFTISAWVWPSSTPTNANQYVLCAHDSGDASYGLIFNVISSGLQVNCTRHGTTDYSWASSNNCLTRDAWNHVLITSTGGLVTGSVTFYINGLTIAQTFVNGSGAETAHTGSWSLGGRIYNDTRNIEGKIAQSAVWDRVLTADEIEHLASRYAPRLVDSGANLIFYYPGNTASLYANPGGAGTADGTTSSTDGPRIYYGRIAESAHSASGADIYTPLGTQTFVETGAGIATAQASGADNLTHIYTESGSAETPHESSGAEIHRHGYSETAQVESPHEVSGADVLSHIYAETSQTEAPHASSGLDAAIIADAGAGVSTRAGSAVDQLFQRVVYVDTGAAVSPHSGSGIDTLIPLSVAGTGSGGWIAYKEPFGFADDDEEILIMAAELLLRR